MVSSVLSCFLGARSTGPRQKPSAQVCIHPPVTCDNQPTNQPTNQPNKQTPVPTHLVNSFHAIERVFAISVRIVEVNAKENDANLCAHQPNNQSGSGQHPRMECTHSTTQPAHGIHPGCFGPTVPRTRTHNDTRPVAHIPRRGRREPPRRRDLQQACTATLHTTRRTRHTRHRTTRVRSSTAKGRSTCGPRYGRRHGQSRPI